MEKECVLKVEKATKYFGSASAFNKLIRFDFTASPLTWALSDISFSLAKGTLCCVLGPNGSGKTTLLKIISTLIVPDKGRVTVNDYRLNYDDEKIKSYVGFMLNEERSFYWRLSGRQNLEFFAALHGLDKKTAQARINELLAIFEINYADKRFDTYSAGMKTHFAFIRCLLHNPELLLLDEPTKSLDYYSTLRLRNFIKNTLVKQQGKTVIFTTHRTEEVADFADMLMILCKGKLAALGSLGELRKKMGNPQASVAQLFTNFAS